MDSYVERKLTEWKFMAFKDNFKENCVDEEVFKMLTWESLNELIPPFKLRVTFWNFYKQYKQQEDDTKKSVVVSEMNQQMSDEAKICDVKRPHEDSRSGQQGVRQKFPSSAPNSVGGDKIEITTGGDGATSVTSSAIGSGHNVVTNHTNVYEDRSKQKSEFLWENLSIKCQKELMSKPLMVLQGQSQNKISLASFLGTENAAELENLVDEYTIHKLKGNIDIHLGTELPRLGETETYFIQRTFLSQGNAEKSLVDLINEMRPGQVTIIFDDAGTGKSVILKVLAQKIKALFSNRWVIFVNLRSYVTVFEKQLDSRGENKSSEIVNRFQEIAVHFFVSEIYNPKNNENEFEINLLKWCLEKSGGVALLFDGFDEISPKYADIVKGLLLGLRSSRVDQLIITTRTHSAADLKKDFQACSYRLRPFNEKDKLNFIVKYWLHNSGCDNLSELEAKASHLIEVFSTSINDKERQFMGIPLQCRLLSEIYKNKLNSSEEWKTMSLYELYRNFTSMKFDEEEKRYQSTTSTSGAENSELSKLNVQKYHWESGFRLLFGEHVKDLMFKRPRKEAEELLLKKVERVGIMTETGPNPVFVHRTFGEFFVAEFFIESIERLEADDFWPVLKFLMEYILRDEILGNIFSSTNVVQLFLENGLKIQNLEEYKFRLIQSSILKAWKLDLRNTFPIFISLFANFSRLVSLREYETYRFLLRCIIIDGNVPSDILTLVAVAVPLPFKWSTAMEIYLQFVSSCPKNVQHIIMLHILCRANVTVRERMWNFFIPLVVDFPGILVTPDSLNEKMASFDEFLKASEEGDVERLRHLLREAGDDDTRFWLLNGGINNALRCITFYSLYYYAQFNHSQYITPLINAIKYNQIKALEFLLDKKAAVKPTINPDLRRPLFWAIERNNLKFLEKLLKRGADKNDYDKQLEMTPLEFACRCGGTEVINSMVEYGCEISATSSVFVKGSIDVLRIIVNRGYNCNQRDRFERTPLHFAVSYLRRNDTLTDVIDFMKLLFANGVDIQAGDCNGKTALHMATEYGLTEGYIYEEYLDEEVPIETKIAYRDLMKFLLENGADIEAKDKKGETPLHFADNTESVTFLLNHGAHIEEIDVDGNTSLHKAASKGRTDVIRTLIKRGANVDVVNKEGETPLHLATSCNAFETLYILLEKGANIEARDNARQTVLHHAVLGHNTDMDVVSLLLVHEADVGAMNNDGDTALQLAITKWDSQMGPMSFPAKEPEVAEERPLTSSLKESIYVFPINDIIAAISVALKQYEDARRQNYWRNLAKILLFLLEHEQQCKANCNDEEFKVSQQCSITKGSPSHKVSDFATSADEVPTLLSDSGHQTTTESNGANNM